MIEAHSNAVLRHIRSLAGSFAAEEVADSELVRQFVRQHDDVSFATLIDRHGPMVLRVCQRVLQHRHDAEDVFQETFLLLARKAAAIRKPSSVASWLHGAAYRLAKKTKSRQQRHYNSLVPVEKPAPVAPDLEAAWRELRIVLDEEFDRLPDKYRTVLVLCFLEGKTHDEAARQLGWPLGTVKCRLKRGRELLHSRLARRGLTLSATGFTAVLAVNKVSATVPAPLVQSTLRQALLPTVYAKDATALADGSLGEWTARSCVFTQVRIIAFVCMIGAIGAGASALIDHLQRSLKQTNPALPNTRILKNSPAEVKPVGKDRFGDPLPPGAALRLGSLRFRHKEAISGVAFSMDGNRLVTAGEEGVLRVWDPTNGKELATFAVPKMNQAAIAFSPNGKQLVAAGGKQITYWDMDANKKLRTISCDQSLASGASFVFAPNGQSLAIIFSDASIGVWNVSDGKLRLRLPAQKQAVRCVSFSPDGKVLLSATGRYQPGGTIRTWNATTGKQLREVQLPKNQILTPFAFSPDGKMLALEGRATKRDKRKGGGFVVYTEYKIHLLDLATGKERLQLKGQEDVIWNAVFSADSKTIAWMGMDNRLIVADTASGRIQHRLQSEPGGARPDSLATLAFSRDGKMVAAVGSSAAVHVWNLSTGRETLANSETHQDRVHDVVYAPGGRMIASAGSDHTVRIWDSVAGKLQHKLIGHKVSVRRLAISSDGKRIASASQDNVICIWDAATGRRLHKIQAVKRTAGVYSGIVPLVFTGDGKKLLSIGDDRQILTWDVATGKELSKHPIYLSELPQPPKVRPRKMPEFKDQIFAAAFSPDGRLLALGVHGTIYVVDTQTGLLRTQLKGQQAPLHLTFSADGKTLLSGGWDKAARLWELASGQEIFKIDKLNYVTSVAFASGGRMVAVADSWPKSRIHLFDTAAGDKLQQFEGHNAYVGGLTFSPDGKFAASAQRDTLVHTWNLTRAHRNIKSLQKDLNSKALQGLWADLRDLNARKAQSAAWTLASSPGQALPFLNKQLQPIKRTSAERIVQLIGELDSKKFNVRERAAKKLSRLGVEAEPALRQTLKGNPSLEVRLRVTSLLANIGQWRVWSTEDLRHLRAVQALERIGTEEAQRILRELASGAPGAILTREAITAQKRLEKQQ